MNHGFVIPSGTVSEKKLEALLREIVRERWGDLVRVEAMPRGWEVAWGTDYACHLFVWLASPRKIEMRKGMGDLSSWLQDLVRETLANRLNGKCGDEGVDNRWVGKPEGYQTFKQWWGHIHGRRPLSQLCFKQIATTAPKELTEKRKSHA